MLEMMTVIQIYVLLHSLGHLNSSLLHITKDIQF